MSLDACVACLAPDMKTFSLHKHDLKRKYETVSGLLVGDEMPQNLCWECAALVNKFNLFRHKCERASLLLQDIYNQHDEHDNIKETDRTHSKLTSPYSISAVTAHHYNPVDDKSESISHFRGCDQESGNFVDLNIVKREEIETVDEAVPDFVDESVSHVGNKKNSMQHRLGSRKSKRRKAKEIKRKDNSDRCKKKRAPTKRSLISARKSCESFATVVSVSHAEQMQEIQRRKDTPSYKQSRHKCTLCHKGFMEERAYENHTLKHRAVSGDFECDVCKIRFRLKRHVRSHICAVHATKYVCRACGHVSAGLDQATNHHKWHTGVTYKCAVCGEVSNKVTTHLSHVRLKHPSRHICVACGRSFVSDKGLTMHARLMHKDGNTEAGGGEERECAACSVRFASLAAWKQHMVLSHRDNAEFGNGCRHCGETFASREEYREHYRQRHKRQRHKRYASKTWEQPRQCEHCEEPVRSALQYYWHIRQSHPGLRYPSDNKFVCELCGRDFKFNASLTYHRRSHNGILPHACALCPRAFPTRAQLDKHASVHSERRPHACHLCPKAFKEKSALSRHVRYHSGARPYPCETCGKAFTEASSRKLHVRSVHLKLPARPARRAAPASAHPV